MTRFWLIRHGMHDWLGRALVGRMAGVSLNEFGHFQARAIAETLHEVPLAAVYCSPMERCRQTAHPLVHGRRLTVRIDRSLDEIDFGEWTGLSFAELATDRRWHRWNSARGRASTPSGESMHHVQRRIVCAIERFAAVHAGRQIALVSHGDVLRAAVAHYHGRSLDDLLTIEFEPGAIALLEYDPPRTRVLGVIELPSPSSTPAGASARPMRVPRAVAGYCLSA